MERDRCRSIGMTLLFNENSPMRVRENRLAPRCSLLLSAV